jgi:K+-sensing histidine kinase KdpD
VLLALLDPPPPELIARTIELATPAHATITVVAVARVFGYALGIPHPGLQPNRHELEVYRSAANDAADRLTAAGFEVRVAMSKARNAPKMISRWATTKRFHAIVVADPERPGWRRKVEGDLAKEIHRRCGVPVYAVPIPSDRGARTP